MYRESLNVIPSSELEENEIQSSPILSDVFKNKIKLGIMAYSKFPIIITKVTNNTLTE
jgi:hypothetical protein